MKLASIGITLFWIYIVICWVVNVIKVLNCDFASPYKEEVIGLLGVVIPPLSGITVWF